MCYLAISNWVWKRRNGIAIMGMPYFDYVFFFLLFIQGTDTLSRKKKSSNILVGNYCHCTMIYTYNLAYNNLLLYLTKQCGCDICAPSTLFGKGRLNCMCKCTRYWI